MPKILIVEDQPAVATALQVLFEIRGLECVMARGPEDPGGRGDARCYHSRVMAENDKKNDVLELAPETRLEAEEADQQGFWRQLKRGLQMTHTELLEKMSSAMEGKVALDARTLEYLEEILIGADLGVDTSLELVERVKRNALREQVASPQKLRRLLADEVTELLREMPQPPRRSGRGPVLTLVVGVNGVGKTTSIAKLARRYQREGRRVLLVAGDTFRAAAIEQLALWGERLGIEVVRQGQGADPGAVVYDAIHAARARGIDELIVDTAGRLHTKDHLMAELGKVRRVIDAVRAVCRSLSAGPCGQFWQLRAASPSLP